MRTQILLLSCLLGVLLVAPVMAQAPPRPGALIDRWLDAQRRRGGDIDQIQVRERARWVFDGPTGTRETRAESIAHADRGRLRWDREPLHVKVDSRPVPPGRWRRLERRYHMLVGPPAADAARMVTHVPWMLPRLRPVGTARPDVVDGRPTWRVDAVPQNAPPFIERYTLWFDERDDRLHRTRALLHGPPGDAPIVVTTDYDRVEGLDVPRHRHIEGVARARRRVRTFTVLYQYDALYDDYRFTRR